MAAVALFGEDHTRLRAITEPVLERLRAEKGGDGVYVPPIEVGTTSSSSSSSSSSSTPSSWIPSSSSSSSLSSSSLNAVCVVDWRGQDMLQVPQATGVVAPEATAHSMAQACAAWRAEADGLSQQQVRN